ncbi:MULTISPECIES: transcription elongation factor GreA [Methylosinus]|uniref:Transcription elongation factor n=1 Tax=Methylosinus trichosporium (strain ATCC 35070 / NCIMB 11131 / UNIQEM 75 / OB3b) TaxID=595536 RepID=A0A2D2D3X4_METT3|nr:MULTISPECIES: transcription elongation factor GreA [Methylosinus]ATQ69710.1 transcription elongation factor [Methylosinus trichosporium OB3b]OBS51206.1 transcription elongation factor [Methylosinus sp. 3S-1]
MSGAFTKEQDDDELREELPDRPISPHRNLVTPEGLAQIEAELARLQSELDAAQQGDDKHVLARVTRDLRYWNARRASAELVHAIADVGQVRFGHRVVVEDEKGQRRSYRLVGEDEADPSKGLIPYVAPLAKELLGKSVGDSAEVGRHSATILDIA